MKAMQGSLKKRQKNENLMGYLFAGPWLFGLIALGFFPIIMSFLISFTNYNMLSSPKWVGITNYQILFTSDQYFWTSLGNTFYHILISVPLGIIVGVALALLLNSKVKGIGVYRTLFYLPNVVSVVAMALLWLWLFEPTNGIVNGILAPIYNLFKVKPLRWYLDANLSKITLILMGLTSAGGSTIIYLAQMQDIPKVLYEQADIDGASRFYKTTRITLPLMTPSIYLSLITGFIGGFQVFTIAYIVTQGGPGRSTYYYAYHIYNTMMVDKQMGMASAMAWVLLVIVLLVTLLVMRLNKFVVYLGEES